MNGHTEGNLIRQNFTWRMGQFGWGVQDVFFQLAEPKLSISRTFICS